MPRSQWSSPRSVISTCSEIARYEISDQGRRVCRDRAVINMHKSEITGWLVTRSYQRGDEKASTGTSDDLTRFRRINLLLLVNIEASNMRILVSKTEVPGTCDNIDILSPKSNKFHAKLCCREPGVCGLSSVKNSSGVRQRLTKK